MRDKQNRRQGHSIYTFQDAYYDSVADYNGERDDWEEWFELSDINDNTYDGFYLEEIEDTYDDEILKIKNSKLERVGK